MRLLVIMWSKYNPSSMLDAVIIGLHIVQAFEDAKRQEMAEDAPRSVDTTLPGWV